MRNLLEKVSDRTIAFDLQEDVMDNAKLAMRRGMKRLNRAFAQSKSNHLLYLALFVVGIFFVVMFWAKAARFLRIFS